MKLRVFLPTHVFLDREVNKVTAEGENGAFGILPKHRDCVSTLSPGLMSFEGENGEEFLAVDEGVFVKQGQEVLVSVQNAIHSKELGELRQAVEEEFKKLDEQERKARSVIARFEADIARRFLELEG